MLPIAKHKEEIISAVQNNPFTIVSAETGSGKSTQIPQFLADYFKQVIVTQPRVMAAKTLAKRVSEELNVELGQEVGYRTAFDSCSSPNSKILYCTDGLQLIRTIFNADNSAENVLIIDEVHEWNLNIETLIAWCKFMYGKWNTKVVIMSATLDTVELTNYFGKENVSVLNIPGTLYDVSVEERDAYAFISSIKEGITQKKNILVFVPGKKEIRDVIDELSDENATVLPLHGELDWDEQKKCFYNYPNSKVVVATNVAQTSITIPDIDIVIDTGKARVSYAKDGIQGLYLIDISKSDIMQRKGRAGRTKNGKYILCSSTSIDYRDNFPVPEIQRSILDRVVLQLFAIGLDAEQLCFYHQPSIQSILNAKQELTAIGAIDNGKITELGHKIVKIPVSVQLARMIVEAEKHGVVKEVLTIAAIVEMGGLLGKYSQYSYFTSERNSDLLAELDVWNSLNNLSSINFKELGVRKKAFFSIKEHIKKLMESLYGLIDITSNADDRNAILECCLYGLASHIFVRSYEYFYDSKGNTMKLDKHSCISDWNTIIIGIPKTIEFKNHWGINDTIDLVSFATKIDCDIVAKIAPNFLKTSTAVSYFERDDTVQITTHTTIFEHIVNTTTTYSKDHPEYERLKEEFELSQKPNSVFIDGKEFEVYNAWHHRRYTYIVHIDNDTLFSTKVNTMYTASGEKIHFESSALYNSRIEDNLVALRNYVTMELLKGLRTKKKLEYANLYARTIEDVIANSKALNPISLDIGYNVTPTTVYGALKLIKNIVSFDIFDDESLAKSNTIEALQHLFIKYVEKTYNDNAFSHQAGSKKKILTDSEKEVKKDFDSFVKELLPDLTVENVAESLSFIEEYYHDSMK